MKKIQWKKYKVYVSIKLSNRKVFTRTKRERERNGTFIQNTVG